MMKTTQAFNELKLKVINKMGYNWGVLCLIQGLVPKEYKFAAWNHLKRFCSWRKTSYCSIESVVLPCKLVDFVELSSETAATWTRVSCWVYFFTTFRNFISLVRYGGFELFKWTHSCTINCSHLNLLLFLVLTLDFVIIWVYIFFKIRKSASLSVFIWEVTLFVLS